MSDGPIVVLCTAPAGEEVAPALARGIVAAGLAACVNVIPGVRSFYRWNDQLCDDSEVQMVIKTRVSRYPELETWIKAHHPYQVPGIVALPIERGSPEYLQWVVAQTS